MFVDPAYGMGLAEIRSIKESHFESDIENINEAKNLIKCIESGYTKVNHFKCVRDSWKVTVDYECNDILKDDFKKIDFVLPKDINTYLDAFNSDSKVQKERIQGYRVNTSYRDEIGTNKINKQQELTNLILSSMRSKKKKK